MRFIGPEVLARITGLKLIARAVVEGFIAGLHRSPYLGSSMDFAEYRAYYPGDDIRRIDWKAFGRSDKLFVKKYRGETNTGCHLLLDVSRSMDYGSGAATKLRYGQWLAASLAYLMSLQQDAAGYISFDHKVREYIPARFRRGHLEMVLTAIDRAEPLEESEFSRPLDEVAERIHRRGIAALISDLLDEPESVLKGIKHLRLRGQDLIVFHLLDKNEIEFPFSGEALFTDLETGREMYVNADLIRNEYQAAVARAIARYRSESNNAGIDYIQINTSLPLDFALYSYLTRRRITGRRA